MVETVPPCQATQGPELAINPFPGFLREDLKGVLSSGLDHYWVLENFISVRVVPAHRCWSFFLRLTKPCSNPGLGKPINTREKEPKRIAQSEIQRVVHVENMGNIILMTLLNDMDGALANHI